MACTGCNKKKEPDVACDFCQTWYHRECVLPNLKIEQIAGLNWYCNKCKKSGLTSLASYNEEKKKLLKRIEDLENSMTAGREIASKTYVDARFSKIESMLADKSSECAGSASSYANVVKQKNLLAIRSDNEDMKAVDKKMEVANILADYMIVETKFPKNGNIVMNFRDKESRDRAAHEIDGKIPNTVVKKIGYLKPKFMLCNVHTDEEDIDVDDKQSISKKLIDRNIFLKKITNIESKIEFLFVRPSAAKTHHLVFKCDPEVRKAIHERNDELKLAFAVYHVRDRYHVRICSYCQRFGHAEKDCPHTNEDPFCRNCAERHKTKDCQSACVKCINCTRKKKSQTNHKVGNKNCETLHEEHMEIAAKTDHGY